MTATLLRVVAPALLTGLLVGCTAEAKTATPVPFAGCSALTGATAPTDLPDLRLPCFTGDTTVALRELRGPAVINLWASWCDPCRKELPMMQRLADQSGGRLTVIGVDTGDRRDAAASFAADAGISFPTLFDQSSRLHHAVIANNLPVTIFLNGTGRSFVNVLPLDAVKLVELVHTHTGVAVTL